MKEAVMYGGGNIGRGFIGALMSRSGYRVTFVDVAAPLVEALQTRGEYPVRYVSAEGYEDVTVRNVTAVSGTDADATAGAIATADLMATAVGARILPLIVPNIVAGLRKRWARTETPLNILICENLMDANLVLERLLKAQLTEAEQLLFDERVGLVEASIGRMVPVQTPEMQDGDPLRVCVERYGYLPTDGAAFKGGVTPLENMVPFAPFDFYIRRKLYIHNMGHAVCAYLGGRIGCEYISQAVAIPEIRLLAQNAMEESAQALASKYDVPLREILQHITDLLHRFGNTALKDTCQRVGGDPARKLSPEDRLIGAGKLALAQGITPAYIAAGAAAGVWRYLRENGDGAQSHAAAQRVLREVSQLTDGDLLAERILSMYDLLLEGGDSAALLRAADRVKADSLRNVI